MTDTLATALPEQIRRVREDVLPAYESMRGIPNVMVEPTIAIINHSINEAVKAAASGDVIAMLRWHEELKGIEA